MNNLISLSDTYKTVKDIGRDVISTIPKFPGVGRNLRAPSRQTGRRRRARTRVPRGIFHQAEVKFLDGMNLSLYPNTTGQFTLLNGVANGTGESERIGRHLTFKHLRYHGTVTSPSDCTHDFIRLMIVIDRQANETAFTAGDLLQNPTDPVNSLLTTDYAARFKVLFDRRFVCNPIASDKVRIMTFSMLIPLNTLTYYSDTGATISDITTNAIYAVTFGSKASGANDTTKGRLNYDRRITFLD